MRQAIYETAEGRRRKCRMLDLLEQTQRRLAQEEKELRRDFQHGARLCEQGAESYLRRTRFYERFADFEERDRNLDEVLDHLLGSERSAAPPAPQPAPVVSSVPTRPAYFSSTAWSKP